MAAPSWRDDLGAGLVVFLVALPLCLGIALASGAPLAAGLITGVLGGVVVSRLSGSQLMVSGPAAGLTAIVLAALAELGSFPAFLVAVVLAGGLQMVLGWLRAGVVAHFFPSAVIRGMLAGIGLILLIKQLPYALGLEVGGTLAATVAGMARQLDQSVPAIGALTLVSLAMLAWWPRLAPSGLRRFLPAPLLVVAVGSLAAWLLNLYAPDLALPERAMVALPVPASPAELAAYLTLPDWSALSNPAVYRVALTLAIVASLETLLSLEATDRLDPLKRSAPPNRELLAQGTGNVLSGLLGGLPMTGVIVRSAANVDAGGRTWHASFIHGVLLLVAVVSVPTLLNHIPLAALAAVLIYTGFKLAHPAQVLDALRRGPRQALPFLATVVAILATDLLIGIAVGLAVGVGFLLLDSARNAYSLVPRQAEDRLDICLALAEQVSFLNKARIGRALHAVPPGATVTVDASRTKHLDEDVVSLLRDYEAKARQRGIKLILLGVPGAPEALAH
ncbi:MAG: SulP family inorganic anion transporter [Rubrivivax sp.]|nr:MAG: SulP family inorganic anion transporter [Rubrivivax sp.]